MNWLQNILPDNLQYALGWTVVHSIWQGIVIASIMAIILMSAKRLSANTRYWIANGSLLLMLVSSAGTFAWLTRSIAAEQNGLLSLSQNADLLREGNDLSQYFDNQDFIYNILSFFNEHISLIVIIWLIGVLFFTLRLMGGLMYIEILKNRHLIPLSIEWQSRMNLYKNRLKIHRAVELCESALVAVPMVIGWLKPIILLPIGTVNNMSVPQVEAILAHELAHISGRDYILNIIQTIVEILFYYHPAVWWISANIRAERENRCDDIAVRLCGNSLTYAKALLALQEMQHQNIRTYGLAMTFSGQRKGFLLKRVKRILNQPQNRSNIMEKFAATGLLLAVVATLSFSNYNNKPDTIPPKDSLISTEFMSSDMAAVLNDSTPKRKGELTIKHEDNGKSVEMKMKDGEITNLKIDGKDIPKEDFDKYEDVTEDLMTNLPTPPAPPTPPNFNAPPAPPAPPTPPAFGTPPTPPAPPMPPTPPTPPRWGIRKEKDAQGNTILRMEKGNGKTSEIKITPDKEVYIDGKKAEEGEKLPFQLDDTEGVFGLNNFNLIIPRFDFDNERHVFKYKNLDSTMIIKIDPKIRSQIRLFQDSKTWDNQSQRIAEEWRLHSKKLKIDAEKMQRDAEKLSRGIIRSQEYMNRNAERIAREQLRNFDNQKHLFKADGDGNFIWHQGPKSAIESELERDGFIKNGKKAYKIELNEKDLKINGKEMPKEMHEKYLRIYTESSGSKPSKKGKFNMTIEEED